MIRSSFTKQTFALLTVLISVGVGLPNPYALAFQGTAEEKRATVSGRVISAAGEPIAGASLMLQGSTVQTDSEGRFTFTEIVPRETQLRVLRNQGPESGPPQPNHIKIRAIKFGKMVFYPCDFHDLHGSAPFTIAPGANIEGVEVIMEHQLIIRGSVVFKNGEPLADTYVKINNDWLGLDGTGGYLFSRSFQTDADGNFVWVVDVPGIYSLSINHRGLSAALEPFIIEVGKPHERVVLTLNGNATDLSESPYEAPKKQPRYRPPHISDVPGVWIINPTNGHAYKWITCDDREDAQIQAAAEEAHLVTITNEPEQIWLEAVFGAGPYWIGLTDVLKEGEWQWEAGDPVTYTNWKEDDEGDQFLHEPPAFLKFLGVKNEARFREEDNEKDYVIMSDSAWDGEIGKWKKVEHLKAARMAIVEIPQITDHRLYRFHRLP